MYRTFNNGVLRSEHIGQDVTLCGWVQKMRDLGGMTFVDLRDRYGITQLVFNMEYNPEICELARQMGREYVIQVQGKEVWKYNQMVKDKEQIWDQNIMFDFGRVNYIWSDQPKVK